MHNIVYSLKGAHPVTASNRGIGWALCLPGSKTHNPIGVAVFSQHRNQLNRLKHFGGA